LPAAVVRLQQGPGQPLVLVPVQALLQLVQALVPALVLVPAADPQ
jgi:hypothetical protein